MDPNNQQMPPATPGQAPTPNPAPFGPPTPPPAPTAQYGSVQPVPGKSKKNMLMIIIIAAVVVAAAVAYGVYSYMSNTPENLIKSAVQNLSTEKALAATVKMENGTADSNVSFTGDVAFKVDPNNAKNGEVVVGIGSGSQRLGVNLLSLDGTMYVKLAQAENLGDLLASFSSDSAALSSTAFANALKNVNDKWFEITSDQVQSLAESSGNDNVTASPSPEDLKKTLEIYTQHPFIKADKTYADEVIDGSNTAHFSVKVDRNEEVKFLEALKAANLATIKVTDEDITKVKDTPEATDVALELWIARDSHKFKQIRMANTKQGEESTITLTLKSELPTFDAFEKPSKTYPISQFYTILLSTSMPSGSLR